MNSKQELIIDKLYNSLIKRIEKQKMKENGIIQCHRNISESCIKTGDKSQFHANRNVCNQCLKIINHDYYARKKQSKSKLAV